jgi:hypothetical protein
MDVRQVGPILKMLSLFELSVLLKTRHVCLFGRANIRHLTTLDKTHGETLR